MGTEPTREDIAAIIANAGEVEDLREYVKQQVEAQFPEMIGVLVRRGGYSYDAIQYILDDLDSYGQG